MNRFKTLAFSFAVAATALCAIAVTTPSMAAGRGIGFLENHRPVATDLAQDRAISPRQYENVERHYDAARTQEKRDASGAVPGSSWASENRAEATRRAIASNHG